MEPWLSSDADHVLGIIELREFVLRKIENDKNRFADWLDNIMVELGEHRELGAPLLCFTASTSCL